MQWFGGGSFIESLDASTQEELGNPIPNQTVGDHIHNIIRLYIQQHLVITQAQILHGSLKHKALKRATELLGFQDDKSTKERINVAENISKEIYKFGKSGKLDIQVARREITTIVVDPRTSGH